MTEDQLEAAFVSLASELSRLSHEIELPPDEDAQLYEDALDTALIIRAMDRLCAHTHAGLARLVSILIAERHNQHHQHHHESATQQKAH
jgi:hypothetical protein